MSNNPIENSCELLLCLECNIPLTGAQKKFCSPTCKRRKFYTNHLTKKQERGWKRKAQLVVMKGGKCERCGYNEFLPALCFHHLDPTAKESGLSTVHLYNMTWQQCIEEASKCMLLCHNCHTVIHYGGNKYSKLHLELSS